MFNWQRWTDLNKTNYYFSVNDTQGYLYVCYCVLLSVFCTMNYGKEL